MNTLVTEGVALHALSGRPSSCKVGDITHVVKYYIALCNCAAELRAQVIVMQLVDLLTVPSETFTITHVKRAKV